MNKNTGKNTVVEITLGGGRISALFGDNAAARKLIRRMPFTVRMDNLYGREMCHRFGRGALPAAGARSVGYRVGDISYWPPLGSLVILYRQNGEVFDQQPIGYTDSDLSFLSTLGPTKVTFAFKK